MNQRRYTNQTFTKRVDHENGAHRPKQKMKGPAYCEACESVYINGQWISKQAAESDLRFRDRDTLKPVSCPACFQVENDLIGGYLSITGGFHKDHHAEITNLLENETERALDDNPLSRIVNLRETDGTMVVETTTEHLAQRLGHALKKAYAGAVKYHFSHENKVARVTWHRD